MNAEEKLNILYDKAFNMVSELDIPISDNITIGLSRAKRRFGLHRLNRVTGLSTILISRNLLENGSDTGITQTIIHELLHSCPGCQNHGRIWKSYARRVNSRYGFNVQRCNSAAELGLPTGSTNTGREYMYEVRCTCCGQVIRRKNCSKLIRHPEYYRCGKCGGVLKLVCG